MTQESQAIAAEYRGYAEAFQDQSVVEAYRHRPPYPASTFDILTHLLPPHFTALLDVGCGRGELARHLVERVERVDAVDVSRSMIEQGKQLPHGNHPRLRWVQGRIEEVQLQPPYALVTAGASLHWMEWNRVMPRFAELLIDGAYLAVVGNATIPSPWTLLGEMLSHYRTDRYISQPPEVQDQDLFQVVGVDCACQVGTIPA
jgi:trans-aconitate methyltransferase